MKQRYLFFVLVSIGILSAGSAIAQLVGDCVFLQGKYVEVGIAPNGGYGSTLPAPSTYHPNNPSPFYSFYDPGSGTTATSPTSSLGFVADYGRDGWTVGSPPYYGDFYIPGTPQEGWMIKVGSNGYNAFIPNYTGGGTPTGYTGAAGLTGTNVGYTTAGGVSRGVWQGSIGSLEIRQTTKLDTNALFFTVTVILVNHGATATPDIYYARTLDPDNAQTVGAGFDTKNTITYQLPNPSYKVLVSAEDTSTRYPQRSYLGLGTKDCRAKCMYFDAGLAPNSGADSMWNQQNSYTYTQGANSISDVGIALAFKIGPIGAGDSTQLKYAYILNAAYIDSALDATQPDFLVNSFNFPSGSVINLCTYPYDTAVVAMGSGGFYHWKWTPNTLLTSDSAISNTIDVRGITSPIVYSVTGVNVAGGCDTIHYNITLKRDVFDITLNTPDTAICLGENVPARVTGPPLLHYSWAPTTGVSNDTIMNPVITPTATTTYTVTASSATGCTPVSKRFTVTVYNPTLDSISKVDPSVCGYSDGKIVLYGLQTGFLDTVHFDKNGVAQTPRTLGVSSSHTLTLTGLSAATYSNIYVKVGLCPTNVRGPIDLVNPSGPVVTVDSPVVNTCVGVPVALHAFATPTGTAYNYSWSPATDLSTATTSNPTVNPSAAGDVVYTISVNPGSDPTCAGTARVRVHTLAPYVLNNRDTVICIRQSVNGSITGSSEFSYAWSPVAGVSSITAMNPILTPTVSTAYVVTASYAHCPDMVQGFHIEVDTPATPMVVTDTICLGMTDMFDFTVPGSVADGNYYHYQWQAPGSADVSNDTLPNPVITPTTLGTHSYSLVINPHAASCSATDVVNILVMPNSITVAPTDTMICLGGSVQVIGAGGSNLFHYQWIPTAGIGVSNTFNAFITPDTSALYTVTASFHRCPDIQATLNLSVQPTPTVFLGGNRLSCQFDTVHLRANVLPLWYNSYAYNWTPSADLDHNNTQSVVFSGTSTTKLYVTVTTPAGCKGIDSSIITVFPGNFASITPDNNNFCPHTNATLLPTAPAGTSFHWYPSLYLNDSLGSSPLISPLASQTYTVVATSADGCNDTFKYSAHVYPAALLTVDDSVTIFPGESYHIQPTSNCNSFAWFPPAGLNDAGVSDPIATPEISTLYKVRGITDNGCEATDSILVTVSDESILALPNAFTPGTGDNNEFRIIKRGLATLNYFRVFNRWGNLMFETKDINAGWDGAYKGKQQPFGVYVYEVQAVTTSGRIFMKHGNVTLLR